jgi:hypothetical protein
MNSKINSFLFFLILTYIVFLSCNKRKKDNKLAESILGQCSLYQVNEVSGNTLIYSGTVTFYKCDLNDSDCKGLWIKNTSLTTNGCQFYWNIIDKTNKFILIQDNLEPPNDPSCDLVNFIGEYDIIEIPSSSSDSFILKNNKYILKFFLWY